jgi:retron-type reverse transcriptase
MLRPRGLARSAALMARRTNPLSLCKCNSSSNSRSNSRSNSSVGSTGGGDVIAALRELQQANTENIKLVNNDVMEVVANVGTLRLAHWLNAQGKKKKSQNVEYFMSKTQQQMIEDVSAELKTGKFEYFRTQDYLARRRKRAKLYDPTLLLVNEKDILVRKALEVALTAVYEPVFSRHSHGFRPGLDFHTCLKEIREEYTDIVWMLKGEVPNFVSSVKHKVLLDLFSKKVSCKRTLNLLEKTLSMPFLEEGHKYNRLVQPAAGVMRQKTMGKLCCNVLFHELDTHLIWYKNKIKKIDTVDQDARAAALQEMEMMGPSDGSLSDSKLGRKLVPTNNIRIQYTRYGNEFVVGVEGNNAIAEEVASEINNFIESKLQLKLKNELWTPTSMQKSQVLFLGTHITGCFAKKLVGGKVTSVRMLSKLSLMFPTVVVFKNMQKLGFLKSVGPEGPRATSYTRITNLPHADILRYFNRVIVQTMRFYSFAENRPQMSSFVHSIKHTCALTLALKYKLRSRRKVFDRYGTLLECPGTGQMLYVPKSYLRLGKFIPNPPPPLAMIPPNLL